MRVVIWSLIQFFSATVINRNCHSITMISYTLYFFQVCDICQKGFSYKSTFRRHQKKHAISTMKQAASAEAQSENHVGEMIVRESPPPAEDRRRRCNQCEHILPINRFYEESALICRTCDQTVAPSKKKLTLNLRNLILIILIIIAIPLRILLSRMDGNEKSAHNVRNIFLSIVFTEVVHRFVVSAKNQHSPKRRGEYSQTTVMMMVMRKIMLLVGICLHPSSTSSISNFCLIPPDSSFSFSSLHADSIFFACYIRSICEAD